MIALTSIQITSPILFAIAIALVALIFLIIARRRPNITRGSRIFFGLGLLSLAMAAGGPIWLHRMKGEVTVMVDLSPSTRGASWRDRVSLDVRVNQILGNTPRHVIAFAESNQALPASETLPDIPADRTVFSPPPADAIVLFSDGRFELPSFSPQTFPVIDPALDQVADASVEQLEFRDRQVVASIHNNGLARSLNWTGAISDAKDQVTASVVRSATASSGLVSATLSAGDLWPENDSLSIEQPPPRQLEKWWVGKRNPGGGWRQLQPGELPDDGARYLNAAVIVLDDISADALSSEQLDRLEQYCRDLGGCLVLIGGDRAFAAGNYMGTALDSISPLASSPQTPLEHWMLLMDGSGSMESDAGDGSTRWQIEIAAILRLVPFLPPNDLVSVGSFAENLRWWSENKSPRETLGMNLPPADVGPHGPTNLQAALESIIQSKADVMPAELLLITDAEAEINHLDSLAHEMIERKIRLHLLAIGRGKALPALQSLAAMTKGSDIEQLDAKQWIAGARQLLRSALPDRLSHDAVKIQFAGELASLSGREAGLWNRTWVKAGATVTASAGREPMAAQWQVGDGRVAAVGYPADIEVGRRIADLFAIPPHDPRFQISCTERSSLHISVDAIDNGSYMNDEQIRLELPGSPPLAEIIPQTGPGRYELNIAAPRLPLIATIRAGERVIERFAIAGRYAPEFDAIGNDRANLKALADRTGGHLIEPGPVQPIDFHWPVKEMPLGSWLNGLGGLFLGLGLLRWQRNS